MNLGQSGGVVAKLRERKPHLIDIREDTYSCTGGIFIRDTAGIRHIHYD